ncbi:MAG: hypothetical protein M3P33_02730 [bacterium]|nr:hypothetical protein [bacterium]
MIPTSLSQITLRKALKNLLTVQKELKNEIVGAKDDKSINKSDEDD